MHQPAHTAYIGIGSNLDNPQQQVATAIKGLRDLGTLNQVSPLYRSKAVGPAGQPDYINAVAELMTDLCPESLLDELHQLEANQNRVREVRWGPRTIDLDILLLDDINLKTNRLTIPHNQMCLRNFVVFPLFDIAPNLSLPDGTRLKDIKNQLSSDGLQRLN